MEAVFLHEHAKITEKQKKEVACLVYDSNPEFYSIFTKNRTHSQARIYDQLFLKYSELETVLAILVDEEVKAVVFYYRAEEYSFRRLVSLRTLLGDSPVELKAILNEKSKQIPQNLPRGSLYISRIAVQSAAQGQGMGRFLIDQLSSHARLMQVNSLCLHVNTQNTHALHFYQVIGFQSLCDNSLAYSLYCKKL